MTTTELDLYPLPVEASCSHTLQMQNLVGMIINGRSMLWIHLSISAMCQGLAPPPARQEPFSDADTGVSLSSEGGSTSTAIMNGGAFPEEGTSYLEG
jgi:hypothetical protein